MIFYFDKEPGHQPWELTNSIMDKVDNSIRSQTIVVYNREANIHHNNKKASKMLLYICCLQSTGLQTDDMPVRYSQAFMCHTWKSIHMSHKTYEECC